MYITGTSKRTRSLESDFFFFFPNQTLNPPLSILLAFSAVSAKFGLVFRKKNLASFHIIFLFLFFLSLLNPRSRHPLRLPLQRVDLRQQLIVRSIRIRVYDDHVEQMPVFILHFPRLLYNILQLLLLETLVILDPLLAKFLQTWRGDEYHVRFQVRISQYLQALRMQIKNTNFTRVYYGSYSFDGGAVIGFLVLSVLDELSTKYIGFELRTRDEMVVLSVHFRVLSWTTRVWNRF